MIPDAALAPLSHWVAGLSREASDAEDWERADYWDAFGLALIWVAADGFIRRQVANG